MESRRRLHELIDQLPDADAATVEKLLEALTEPPAQRTIRIAPPDDEPMSPEEEDAIRVAESDGRPPLKLDDLLREFGIK